MTPCEKLGYKVGDEFVVVETKTTFELGSKVRLIDDDGTSFPKFEGVGCKANDGGDWHFMHLSRVKPSDGEYPITLQPGDYVSTEGMTEDQYHAVARAFMEAGAESGEYPDPEEAEGEPCFGWSAKDGRGMFHGTAIHRRSVATHLIGRHLTIDQVLNATNAGTTTPQPEQPTMTTDPITTLKQARQARDEAEQAYQDALEEEREYLGEGFELTEVGTDGPLVDGEDMADPANWREGDVFEVMYDNAECADVKKGDVVVLEKTGNDVFVCKETGYRWHLIPDCVKFHHRPK